MAGGSKNDDDSPTSSKKLSLDEILRLATQREASDVHLKAGTIPVIRKHGSLRPLAPQLPPVGGEELMEMAFALMNKQQKEHFHRDKDLDLSYGIPGLGRFRINIFQQRGTIRLVIRNIPDQVRSLPELNLPEIVEKIANTERGLVLVTGATGSGKTSTLAGIINHINQNKSKHIVMIEDPTEFLIRDRHSIITQRELGMDTFSFARALRAALRQDPDVILIGEMRDQETIETALLAAETGHLVLSSLHTTDAQETVNRILAAFPPHHQMQIRLQMANVTRAVISQRLARRMDRTGFHPVVEILINNPRVAECIADPTRTKEIRKVIEEGAAWGMQTFDQHLMELLAKNIIDREEALGLSTNPENMTVKLAGVTQNQIGRAWENTHFRNQVAETWQNIDELEVEDLTDFGKPKRPPARKSSG